uniref:Biogenesis of lysosome-related organelles complex 1 subunit 7 n=1 Tax=Noccaea caerulescens TaxID=107243 RepID=A0A1J3HBX9_NOCCA
MEQLSESNRRDSADATSSSSPTVADGGGDGGEDLARGLSAMLESVIRDFDSKTLGTLNSQDQLSGSLDRLVQELDQLLENAPLPFIVQHASRISSVRQRVSSLNLVLKSIQRRIDNIDQMLSANTTQEKTGLETT